MTRDKDTEVRMQTRPRFMSIKSSILSGLEERMNELSAYGWNAMGFPQYDWHAGFFIMMTKRREIPIPTKPLVTIQFVDSGPRGEG